MQTGFTPLPEIPDSSLGDLHSWDKITPRTTGTGSFNSLPSRNQSPFPNMAAREWMLCFSTSRCHQWYFESQSASQLAFQLSYLSAVGLLTHLFPLPLCQLNKLLTSPPSCCAAQLFTLLTSACGATREYS